VHKWSGVAINKQTHLSKNTVGDVIVVDINRWGEIMIRIVNIYYQREAETGERPARRLNWPMITRQGGGGELPSETFNGHSQLWDLRCP
jgi:hypothetical protein